MLHLICFRTFVFPPWVWSVPLRDFHLYYLVLYYFAQSLAEKSHLSFYALALSRCGHGLTYLVCCQRLTKFEETTGTCFPVCLHWFVPIFHSWVFFTSCVWPWFDFLFPAPGIRGSMIYVCSQMPRLPAGKWTLPSAIPLWLLARLWKQERVLKCRMF